MIFAVWSSRRPFAILARNLRRLLTMTHPTIGLVVPFAEDKVPAEGPIMYPDVTFVPRGVGVRALTPEGYDPAMAAILPAAEHLARQNVDAIMVIGTSLTFYKGAAVHRRLLDDLRAATGLPVSTMSQAVIDGLRGVGAKKVAVATAYDGEVNRRLEGFLTDEGFAVGAIDGFGITEFGGPERMGEQDILDLGARVCEEAGEPEGLLISCGGLRTLGVARPFERQHGVPVVTSTQSAFWAAMRLVGESGKLTGYGRMLEESAAPVH
jgi:arylmalonate decarboxylase